MITDEKEYRETLKQDLVLDYTREILGLIGTNVNQSLVPVAVVVKSKIKALLANLEGVENADFGPPDDDEENAGHGVPF